MDVETHTAKHEQQNVTMFTYTHHIQGHSNKRQTAGYGQARCQAQGGTPRRNTSLAFRLERLQKFRNGVPPFRKVPVWRSGAFQLSLSTAYSEF